MSRKSIVTAFNGFLSKYSGEATAMSTVLSMIVSALPVQAQDKANMQEHIAHLAGVAGSVEKSLAKAAPSSGVSDDDIAKAVSAFMADDDNFRHAVDRAVADRLAGATDDVIGARVKDQVDAYLVVREQGNPKGDGLDLTKSDAHDTATEQSKTTTRELQNDAPGSKAGDKTATPGTKAATGGRAADKSA